MNVFIVIPAYNEESKIDQAISDLLDFGYQNIIIVDDGSTDLTKEIVSRHNVILLSHIVNRGQGAALRTGMQHAIDLGAEYIVHFDADLQMNASDIKYLLQEFESDAYDVVIGSRFLGTHSNIPIFRKILLFATRVFNRLFLGIKIKDPQSGFRVLNRHAAIVLDINHDRMAHCSQMMQDMHLKGLRIKEVPVTINYTEYSLKKGQKFFDAFKIIKDLIFGKIFR